jgi:hypothetical protein
MLPQLTGEQIAERRRGLPLRPWPLAYFAFAHLCLLWAALTLAWDPRGVAGFFYHPRMLAVVHLVTLGWISSSILGALYLVLPMAFRAPLRKSRLDGWIFGIHVTGVLGMVSHFWIDSPNGMVWSAATAVLGFTLAAVRFGPAVSAARSTPAVRFHLYLAFANVVMAGLLGTTVGLNKFFPFLPGGPLSGVLAHAHLAILGWATLLVMGVGYRLIPMLLPSAVPSGPAVWCSAVLMELGTLILATGLLVAPTWTAVGVVLCAMGVLAFGYQLVWMRRNARPAPQGRRTPDLGIIQVGLSIGYLALASLLGLWLVFGEPGVWKLRAAMAYGAAFLLGFFAQIVVGVGSRIVPWAAYLWGFADRGFRETPPPPHALPERRLQWIVLGTWLLGVPAIGAGLAFDRIRLIGVGGWLLSSGILTGGWLLTMILNRAGASARSPSDPV